MFGLFLVFWGVSGSWEVWVKMLFCFYWSERLAIALLQYFTLPITLYNRTGGCRGLPLLSRRCATEGSTKASGPLLSMGVTGKVILLPARVLCISLVLLGIHFWWNKFIDIIYWETNRHTSKPFLLLPTWALYSSYTFIKIIYLENDRHTSKYWK